MSTLISVVNKKKPRTMPGLDVSFTRKRLIRSILCNIRSTPVELIIDASRSLLDDHAGRDDIRSAHGPGCCSEGNVVASEVGVVIFAKHRPAAQKHPFEATTEGPTGPVVVRGLGAEWDRYGAEDGVDGLRPGAAALDVAQHRRNEQVTNAASEGEDVLGPGLRRKSTDGRTWKRRRNYVPAVDVAEVEHALHADHPFRTKLIVATDLGATNHVAALARAEIGAQGNAGDVANTTLVGPGTAAADVATNVTAGPVVGHNRGGHRRSGIVGRHIRGAGGDGDGDGDGDAQCNHSDRTSQKFVHVRPKISIVNSQRGSTMPGLYRSRRKMLSPKCNIRKPSDTLAGLS